jgi:hypothetical protein
MDNQKARFDIGGALKRVADLPATGLVNEEDVKNKVVLPVLRALAYKDADFNYERRTGRGFVDIDVDQFPTGAVITESALCEFLNLPLRCDSPRVPHLK